MSKYSKRNKTLRLQDHIIREQIGKRTSAKLGRKRKHLLRESNQFNIADTVVSPEVRQVLLDAASLLKDEPVAVIGNIALSAHGQPRYTENIDLILATDHLPKLMEALKSKLKKISDHAMERKKTNALVKLVDPDFVGIDPRIVDSAITDAARHEIGPFSRNNLNSTVQFSVWFPLHGGLPASRY